MSLPLRGQIQLVTDQINRGYLSGAQAQLNRLANEHGWQLLPGQAERLCQTLQDCSAMGMSIDQVAGVFEKQIPPTRRPGSEPTPTYKPSLDPLNEINSQLRETANKNAAGKFVDAMVAGSWKKAAQWLRNIFCLNNEFTLTKTPIPVPIPVKTPKGDIAAVMQKVNSALAKKIDPSAISRAVVEGFNPRNGIKPAVKPGGLDAVTEKIETLVNNPALTPTPKPQSTKKEEKEPEGPTQVEKDITDAALTLPELLGFAEPVEPLEEKPKSDEELKAQAVEQPKPKSEVQPEPPRTTPIPIPRPPGAVDKGNGR